MSQKKQALIAIGALFFSLSFFFDGLSGRDSPIYGEVLLHLAVYWWYYEDYRERSFAPGLLQSAVVLALPHLGLPIYFVRSRGWQHGLRAILVAGLAWVAFMGLAVGGEYLGQQLAPAAGAGELSR